ncbi:unnamed protein product [Ambrosiozyma monospora]|uniref:Unnamed protein product n=1 Tax=Ambrosiozyma monospora TaxID=43982 RepID=A0A9W6T613_AMBMO|nr:unnamed protein product [Ambrosiozyma monospora]
MTDEKQTIDEENRKFLQQFSSEEIMETKNELLNSLDPKLLNFILKRASKQEQRLLNQQNEIDAERLWIGGDRQGRLIYGDDGSSVNGEEVNRDGEERDGEEVNRDDGNGNSNNNSTTTLASNNSTSNLSISSSSSSSPSSPSSPHKSKHKNTLKSSLKKTQRSSSTSSIDKKCRWQRWKRHW